jgi:hypothetical protein
LGVSVFLVSGFVIPSDGLCAISRNNQSSATIVVAQCNPRSLCFVFVQGFGIDRMTS